jgi:hypothetical protein
VLLLPVTVAVNCCVALVCRLAEVGLIVTDTTGGTAVTVTVAEAFLVVSATLVAVTVNVPAEPGAVYNPLALMVPPVAAHVTAVFVLPVTVAVNCCVPPTCTEVADRFRETDTPLGLGELLELPLTNPVQPDATMSQSRTSAAATNFENLLARSDMALLVANALWQSLSMLTSVVAGKTVDRNTRKPSDVRLLTSNFVMRSRSVFVFPHLRQPSRNERVVPRDTSPYAPSAYASSETLRNWPGDAKEYSGIVLPAPVLTGKGSHDRVYKFKKEG